MKSMHGCLLKYQNRALFPPCLSPCAAALHAQLLFPSWIWQACLKLLSLKSASQVTLVGTMPTPLTDAYTPHGVRLTYFSVKC